MEISQGRYSNLRRLCPPHTFYLKIELAPCQCKYITRDTIHIMQYYFYCVIVHSADGFRLSGKQKKNTQRKKRKCLLSTSLISAFIMARDNAVPIIHLVSSVELILLTHIIKDEKENSSIYQALRVIQTLQGKRILDVVEKIQKSIGINTDLSIAVLHTRCGVINNMHFENTFNRVIILC